MALDKNRLHFETLQLHVGQEEPDPATDARAVPIYQTTSYVFRDSQHAADRFALKDPGNIYGRLTNSTQAVLEERIAALEGGSSALALASGAAAVTYTILGLTLAGDHIVSANTIYGGTYNLLDNTLPVYGITTTFVDPSNPANFEAAIRPETKALYIETLGNPNCNCIKYKGDSRYRPQPRTPFGNRQYVWHTLPDTPYRTRGRYRGAQRHQIHRRSRHIARRCDC